MKNWEGLILENINIWRISERKAGHFYHVEFFQLYKYDMFMIMPNALKFRNSGFIPNHCFQANF